MRVAMSSRVTGVALASVLSIMSFSQAHAANWWEMNWWMSGPRYDRKMPACDYPGALDRIIEDFRVKENRFWKTDLRIVGIEDIHETTVQPWAAQSIPRRYCSGMAVINDGGKHPIYYSIAEATGMIGMDWGVNFCVVGYDRNSAYNPNCRSAQP